VRRLGDAARLQGQQHDAHQVLQEWRRRGHDLFVHSLRCNIYRRGERETIV
jgi:hypothetical protein